MKSLGVEYVYQGHENKIAAFNEIIQSLSIQPEQAAHVGDDLLDLPIMKRVGLSIAVNDANEPVKEYADWCTKTPGGRGAVREICDFIMQSQGTFEGVLKSFMQ
jgi:3-deoxy-D-manno-octulosonate 8-phosphate phosphatase (KDO 8-P phosphatase)